MPKMNYGPRYQGRQTESVYAPTRAKSKGRSTWKVSILVNGHWLKREFHNVAMAFEHASAEANWRQKPAYLWPPSGAQQSSWILFPVPPRHPLDLLPRPLKPPAP